MQKYHWNTKQNKKLTCWCCTELIPKFQVHTLLHSISSLWRRSWQDACPVFPVGFYVCPEIHLFLARKSGIAFCDKSSFLTCFYSAWNSQTPEKKASCEKCTLKKRNPEMAIIHNVCLEKPGPWHTQAQYLDFVLFFLVWKSWCFTVVTDIVKI